uniref:Uncharacterized protein n=1 Tax=Verrucosispora sp. MS100047 TaxID=1410949 RepID=A0A097CSY7_9ACTN|nr:hypothetical protein VASRM7_518 [Verrucosispora sp. MS100047]
MLDSAEPNRTAVYQYFQRAQNSEHHLPLIRMGTEPVRPRPHHVRQNERRCSPAVSVFVIWCDDPP